MMLQLKVTELGLDDSSQLQQINRVAGENDVRCTYVVCLRICYRFPILFACQGFYLLTEWDGGMEDDVEHSTVP